MIKNAISGRHPAAVIAVLLYNHEKKLRDTLTSLANQDRGDFAVLLVDDASTDGTPAICQDFADNDQRFLYLRNKKRRGYIGNARHALREARRLFPDALYFAWASDHDVYHESWFSAVAVILENNPSASLAWSLCKRIDANSQPMDRVVHRFETRGLTDPIDRFRVTLKASLSGETVVGNMAYGLFRRDVFNQGPGLRYVLIPDRILILEAALLGECLQVPVSLWYRRYADIASIARQRHASFQVFRPWYLPLPAWLTHVGHFFVNWMLRGQGMPQVSRQQAFAATLIYLVGYLRWHLAHRLRLRGPQWHRAFVFRIVKPLDMVRHRTIKRLRIAVSAVFRRHKSR